MTTVTSVDAGRVVAEGLVFPEGPRFHDGALWLSDMHAHRVLRIDPSGTRPPEVVVEDLGDKTSGLGFMPDGSLLVVSMVDRALIRVDTGSGATSVHADLSHLSDEFANDLVVDGEGRAYVGCRREGGGAAAPKDVIVLVEPDGKASVAADGLHGPNGMVIDDGGTMLVVAETPVGKLTRFEIGAGGALGPRSLFASVPGEVFDGICLDAGGCIWTATGTGGSCLRLAPGGAVEERIDADGEWVIACALGGAERRELFLILTTTTLENMKRGRCQCRDGSPPGRPTTGARGRTVGGVLGARSLPSRSRWAVPGIPEALEERGGFWAQAYSHPDKIAIIGPGDSALTFGDLVARVNRLSHMLRSLGLDAGDHAAYLLPNRPEVLEVVLACFQIGLIYTPINHHLLPDEVTYIVEDCNAKVFIADERFADLAVAGADAADIDSDHRLSVGGEIPTFRSMVTEAARFTDDLPEKRRGGSVMMYTSGTTGRPKGVMRGAMVSDIVSMVEFALAPARMCGWSDQDMYLSQCPLYFSGPISNCSQMLHLGATAILMDHWTAEECLALIDRHKVTASMMVPTMFHRLLALPHDVRARYDVSSLRHNAVLQGAGMCPVDDKQAMLEWWGPVFYETYGGTEGRYTCISSEEWLTHPGSVGRAADGMEVRVFDDDGNECGSGEVGMVYGKLQAG